MTWKNLQRGILSDAFTSSMTLLVAVAVRAMTPNPGNTSFCTDNGSKVCGSTGMHNKEACNRNMT